MYEQELNDFAETMEFKFIYPMSHKDFSELLAFDATINFFFRGEFVPNEVLEQLNGIKVNLSSEPFPRIIEGKKEFTADSIERYFTFRTIRNKRYDYVFHYDASSLSFMKSDGLLLSGDFAFPVATSIYKPENILKQWDLFFIGRSTTHREAFFSPLKHYYNFINIAHGIWGEGLVKYINSSRICLNVHAENEVSWEPRLQMLLACGAFVISEKITPNKYLCPGLDFVEISNQHEMFDAVTYYLNCDGERQSIASNGFDKINNLLCSKCNFTNLIEGIIQERYPRFSTKQSQFSMEIYLEICKLIKIMVNRLKNIN
jgi:hypothetical protein